MVLGRCPQHCLPAISIFRSMCHGHRSVPALTQRIEIYHQQIDPSFPAAALHTVRLFIAPCQQTAMNFRVKCFYPAIHDLRKAGHMATSVTLKPASRNMVAVPPIDRFQFLLPQEPQQNRLVRSCQRQKQGAADRNLGIKRRGLYGSFLPVIQNRTVAAHLRPSFGRKAIPRLRLDGGICCVDLSAKASTGQDNAT